MISITANTGPIEAYGGAVAGILSAIASSKSKEAYLNKYMDVTKEAFMVDAVAANESGGGNIRHVFEWGDEQGTTSDIPLFRLIKVPAMGVSYLTYEFLPSTRPVPLPSVQPEGGQLKPHIFRQKALVMETMESVTIEPKNAKALFIPAADQPRGYLMTKKPVTVNPGGNSTGGFEAWWMNWFETRGQDLMKAEAETTAQFIGKTGQTIIRDNTTGRFAPGTAVSFGYAEAAMRNAELQMAAAIAAETS